MNILFIGDEQQMEEIEVVKAIDETSIFFEKSLPEDVSSFEVIFFLNKAFLFSEDPKLLDKYVVVNDVSGILSSYSSFVKIARFNGWPTFLKNPLWEVASKDEEEFKNIFKLLNREAIFVKDQPGLISARVISMIINEAFYALNEEVSTKEEIDLAMKNGTNYPYGPFEWGEKIGLKNVFDLLSKLSETDESYSPAFTF